MWTSDVAMKVWTLGFLAVFTASHAVSTSRRRVLDSPQITGAYLKDPFHVAAGCTSEDRRGVVIGNSVPHDFGNAPNSFEVIRRGDRKPSFDDIHAEFCQLVGNVEFLFACQCGSRRLFSISQGGIEDTNVGGIRDAMRHILRTRFLRCRSGRSETTSNRRTNSAMTSPSRRDRQTGRRCPLSAPRQMHHDADTECNAPFLL